MTKYQKLESADGLKRDDIVPYYRSLIINSAVLPKDEAIRVNNLILSKWTSSGLVYIKNKAWGLVK